jgi:superfamily II DNA or RNA helicase
MFWYLYYADNFQYNKLGITSDPIKRFRAYTPLMGNDGHYYCLIKTSLPKSRMEVYEREILRLTLDNAPPSDRGKHERRIGSREDIMNIAINVFDKYGIRYTLEPVNDFKPKSKYSHNEIEKNKIPIFLRDYQEKIVNEWEFNSGIVVMPPGMGKTITACAMISKYLRAYPEGRILWHVKMKDIISSQWSGANIDIWMASGILTIAPKIYISNNWDGQILEPPYFVVCNSHQVDRITKVLSPSLIITDECHNITAPELFSTLMELNGAIHIGLSATPIKKSFRSMENIHQLYNSQMLANISIFSAIDEGYLVPFTIKAMLYNTAAGSNTIIGNIRNAIENSATKKIICWAEDIKSVNRWGAELAGVSYEYFNAGCFISTSGNDAKCEIMDKFIHSAGCGIMICANRFREGTDDPNIDTGINLDIVNKREYHVQIQMLGRLLRTARGKLMATYIDIQEIGNEEDKSKKIMDCIISYCSLINNNIYPLFRVEPNGISIRAPNGNIIFRIEIEGNMDVEVNEELYLRTCEELRREWAELKMPYAQFISIIKGYGIECEYEYYQRAEELNLPYHPEAEYGRFNWADLYVAHNWYSLRECRERITKLERFKSPLPSAINYHYYLQDERIPKDVGHAYGIDIKDFFLPKIFIG